MSIDLTKHEAIASVRGYMSYTPRQTAVVAAVMEALELDLDMLVRPDDRYSLTANPPREHVEWFKRAAAAGHISTSEIARFCMYAGARIIAQEVPEIAELGDPPF